MAADQQIMVDLETLGVRDGAAILKIALIAFSLDPTAPATAELELPIALDSEHFGEIDGRTVGWWMGQSKEAINDSFFGPHRGSLKDAMGSFAQFLDTWAPNLEGFWSKGPTFDEILLRGAWERCGMDGDFPVKFWHSRCVRTAEKFIKTPIPFEGQKHTAIADARHQVKIVRAAFRGA
jgi:exodeoxyribonuclease VIII